MVGAGVVGAGADFVGARAQFVGAGPRPLHLRCHSSPSHSLRALHPCHATVWVYCEDPQLCGDHYKECWLKHLAHPDATAPAKEGPDVGWTTGLMSQHSDDASLAEGVSRRYAQRRGAAHASPPPCPPPPLASLLAPPPCPVRTVACRHPCWPSGGPHRAAACLPAAAWRARAHLPCRHHRSGQRGALAVAGRLLLVQKDPQAVRGERWRYRGWRVVVGCTASGWWVSPGRMCGLQG